MTNQAAILAARRLPQHQIAKTMGAPLNSLVQKMMALDIEFVNSASESELAKLKRRCRKIAFKTSCGEQHAILQSQVSVQEMKTRHAAQNASAFAARVLEHAQSAMGHDIVEAASGGDDDDIENVGSPDDFEETEDPLEQEQMNESGERRIEISYEADPNFDSQEATPDPVSRMTPAKSIVEIILTSGLCERKEFWHLRDRTCPLCRDDKTISEKVVSIQPPRLCGNA